MRPQQCHQGTPRRRRHRGCGARSIGGANPGGSPARLLHWPALTMRLHLAMLAALSRSTTRPRPAGGPSAPTPRSSRTPSGSGFGCGGGGDSATLASAAPDETAGVRVWASGETGMFRYDVVSSEDPAALRT